MRLGLRLLKHVQWQKPSRSSLERPLETPGDGSCHNNSRSCYGPGQGHGQGLKCGQVRPTGVSIWCPGHDPEFTRAKVGRLWLVHYRQAC